MAEEDAYTTVLIRVLVNRKPFQKILMKKREPIKQTVYIF